ncbi:hypothetical protein Ancab_025142 [Ancistrocladus abbreviatus]
MAGARWDSKDRVVEAGMRVKNDVKWRKRGSDHTNTNTSDSSSTPQICVPGREKRRVRNEAEGGEMSVITSALMPRIPPELYS